MFLRIFCLILFLFPAAAGAGELAVYTEELPPLNYLDKEKNRADGFSVRVVEELITRTGIKIKDGKILVYPWARAMKIVQNEPDAMLFSMTKTKEREPMYKWVGPIAPRTVWLWKLKRRTDIKVSKLEDAKQYTIGGVYEFAMSGYLKEHGFKVEMATKISQNWQKLFSDRIDLGTALELEAAYYMNKFGRSYTELEKVAKVDDRYHFYIALSPSTPDVVVDRLQKALDDMKSDGAYERIRSEFLR